MGNLTTYIAVGGTVAWEFQKFINTRFDIQRVRCAYVDTRRRPTRRGGVRRLEPSRVCDPTSSVHTVSTLSAFCLDMHTHIGNRTRIPPVTTVNKVCSTSVRFIGDNNLMSGRNNIRVSSRTGCTAESILYWSGKQNDE